MTPFFELAQVVKVFIASLTLAGCVAGGTASNMTTSNMAVSGLLQANEPPSKADYALSCQEVHQRVENLYARYSVLEKEQRARQQQASLINGVVGMGTTMVGGNAIMNAGSATAIRNASLAANYGGNALSALASQESSTQQLKDVNDTMLIAKRIGQLEKVKFEKGC
ncbi:hypothetical protein [Celeribacter naphthalenivorans]|uniref:hypothetical protein n=1 Tax=Celeribacter naphthalenivorans TaxID=1614694 RepID=UPI001CFC3CED|nr:hypothetical protein [Celeribacter naphthalenivorans]